MSRIYLHADWRPELDPDVTVEERDEQWATMVHPLFERAVALGGRVVGWGARSVTIDFAWDGLYDAIDFLVDAPLAPELAVGICHGECGVVCDGGRIAFVMGPPLRIASELAQLARPGECLLSPETVEKAAGRLGTTGEVGKRPGRPDVRAFILDPDRPLVETLMPAPPSREEVMELVPNEERQYPPSSRAPASEFVRQVDRLASTAEALGDAAPTVFSPEVSSALRKRDAASLHQLAATVSSHATPQTAERLNAMAELAGGNSGEALRRLRQSKEKASPDDPSELCRASLALAVALASAGRPYEAALEGLGGIARAREGGDERGERACARFLSQLALTFRDQDSAESWAKLGA